MKFNTTTDFHYCHIFIFIFISRSFVKNRPPWHSLSPRSPPSWSRCGWARPNLQRQFLMTSSTRSGWLPHVHNCPITWDADWSDVTLKYEVKFAPEARMVQPHFSRPARKATLKLLIICWQLVEQMWNREDYMKFLKIGPCTQSHLCGVQLLQERSKLLKFLFVMARMLTLFPTQAPHLSDQPASWPIWML